MTASVFGGTSVRHRPSHRAARRPAWFRGALATTVAAAVVAGGGVLAAPATATTAPAVRVVPGNRTISIAWGAVPGATGYTVRWSGVDHQVTARQLRITGLTNGRKTAVRVTARGVTGSSTTVSATPSTGYPLAITGVSAKTGSGDSIRVHATGGGRATRIGVIAGGNSTTKTFHFHTAWYPATQRDFTVTVPSSLRTRLGHATGNFVYVKVVQTNSTGSDPTMGLTGDVSAAYRVSSPPGTRALAGVADPPAGSDLAKVTVGEMNVQSISATAGFTTQNQWVNRAPRVAKTMLAAHPDVLLTAELSTAKLDAGCTNHPSIGYWCPTQHRDLAHRLAVGGGYRDAFPDAEQRMATASAAHPTLERGATFGAHIFFDARKFTLGAHDTISPRLTLKVPWPSDIADRWLSWAVLNPVPGTSGKPFVVVAVHLPAGHRSADITARADEAKALTPYLDGKANGLPIVVAGDFNADPINDPNPDMRILLERGYFDSAATPHRIGSRYATFDGHNGTDGADYGYPLTVHPYAYAATRIDFILMKNSPYTYRYENVLHFASGSSTTLDPTYRGSDHLFQLATIGIGNRIAQS
jgi:endonuclease/exonuclease/phosphatase family metal-dependent hydrolase